MTITREHREPSARRKAALDPSCYRTLAAFRKAVANGTIDVSKGCRTMGEYHWSAEKLLIYLVKTGTHTDLKIGEK